MMVQAHRICSGVCAMTNQFKAAYCAMEGANAVSADTSHAFSRHMHDQFGIGLIMRGAQKSLSGRGIVEAEVGDIIAVNPGEVHDGSPIGDKGRAWRMLYFDPAALADPFRALTDGSTRIELSYPAKRDPAAAAYFLSAFRAMTDPLGGYSEIEWRESLLGLLARLIERRNTKEAGPPNAIERARARIDDDPCGCHSLAELALIGGVSQFQLVRGFSKATGFTPHAYLVQRRLQLARQMITKGIALSDVALMSGFADQSHMTRLFGRTYGVSPGVYADAMS